ncbi:MAG: metal-dependent phosphohydrolase, partial [Pirellula staleyi]
MIDSLQRCSQAKPWEACADGLFGKHRRLYKRVTQFDCHSHPEQHRALARKPYGELVELSERLVAAVSRETGIALDKHDILIDAPPIKLEIQFQLDVRQPNGEFRSLGELSPVVNALATRQFDDMVKRVRIFVRPDRQAQVANVDFAALLF